MIHYLLDFMRRQSVTVPTSDGAFMDRTATDQTIKVLLSEIHRRLDDAARIAKAAEACASAGSVAEGVSVSMDIERN